MNNEEITEKQWHKHLEKFSDMKHYLFTNAHYIHDDLLNLGFDEQVASKLAARYSVSISYNAPLNIPHVEKTNFPKPSE